MLTSTSGNASISGPFSNYGTVNVEQGRSTLYGSGDTVSSGSFMASAGTSLFLYGVLRATR